MTRKHIPYDQRFGTAVETWSAWKLGERESHRLAIDETATLATVVSDAMRAIFWQPGDRLAVQHSHTGRNEHTLRLYTIKKSKAGFWRESTNGGRKVFVPLLIPALDSQIALAQPFAPVEAFDAFKNDPVGIDLSLVEGTRS